VGAPSSQTTRKTRGAHGGTPLQILETKDPYLGQVVRRVHEGEICPVRRQNRCLHFLAPYVECWLNRILSPHREQISILGVAMEKGEKGESGENGKRILVLRGDRHPAGD
jgi:hypothetical protein